MSYSLAGKACSKPLNVNGKQSRIIKYDLAMAQPSISQYRGQDALDAHPTPTGCGYGHAGIYLVEFYSGQGGALAFACDECWRTEAPQLDGSTEVIAWWNGETWVTRPAFDMAQFPQTSESTASALPLHWYTSEYNTAPCDTCGR